MIVNLASHFMAVVICTVISPRIQNEELIMFK